MSWRGIAWIVLAVVGAHLAAFALLSKMKPLPDAPYSPPPNFGYKTTTYIDPATGEKTIEREIRVSTKLAPPGTYEAQPKPVATPPADRAEPNASAEPAPPKEP